MSYPKPAKDAAARAYNAFNMASFTIGTKSGNVINVAVALKDARGQAPQGPVVADLYLSDAAAGTAITGTSATLAVGTNGAILAQPVSGKSAKVVTNSAGLIDLNVTQASSPVTYYLVVVFPDGSIAVSAAITF